MEKVFVFGHKKPDTDSVCGAISFAYLKRQIGVNAEARVLGEINRETQFALKKFNIDIPKYLNDVKVELKDIKYNRDYYANQNDSIFSATSKSTPSLLIMSLISVLIAIVLIPPYLNYAFATASASTRIIMRS